MIGIEKTAIAQALLAREGLLLDRQQWDDWLALYADDCEYWVPAWRSDGQLVSDVQREVSLIYYSSRAGLEDRVVRVRSNKSVTAMPLPRTAHSVSNLLLDRAEDARLEGQASWTVHLYDPRAQKQHVLFGRYEFTLLAFEGDWKFGRKRTVLANDLIPAVLDFYTL